VQTQVLAQRLPRFTPATRTDAAWIAADLQRIRTRGYLLTTDEVVAGAATVACPVRDASGQVVAVLSVSAPTMRMRPPRPRALLPMVLDAAVKLSRALGAVTAEAVGRGETGRKGHGTQHEAAATSVLAASGPHSIFR
jgi:DNA-binding IclR family transcriptional regulator